MNLKIIVVIGLLIFCVLSQNTFSKEKYKVSNRDNHQDPESGLVLNALSSTQQSLELNAEHNISVQLISSGVPLGLANIDWTISQQISSGGDQLSAYFVSDGSIRQTLLVASTDENGISQVTINSGGIVSSYIVTASVSINLESSQSVTLKQTFNLVVGISSSIKDSTPEDAVATSFDTLCPQLQESINDLTSQQQALLDRCNEILQAISEGKTLEVSQVLRQLSPEEVAIQSAVGNSFTRQQASNISTRLTAVRRGTQNLSFNNLMFSYDGQIIPLGYMLSSVFSASETNSGVPGGLLSKRWGVFANGNISVGNRTASSREDGYEFDNYGLTLGADYRIRSTSFVGATIGLARGDVKIDNAGGGLSANGISIGTYGTHYVNDQMYVDGIFSLGTNEFELSRNIDYDLGGSTVDRIAKSNTEGLQHGLSVGAGYEIPDGALLVTLYGRLNYSGSLIDGFTETGAQELNMKIEEQNTDSLLSSIGAQLVYTHSARWGVLMPFIWFSWEHEFSGESDNIRAAFADDQFSSAFNIATEKEDINYFTSGQGVSVVLPRGVSLYARMENVLGRQHYAITNFAFGGRIELEF